MASGIMGGLPRPTTSNGLPKMNLPLIQHPSCRMGDKSRLSIRGESRQGPGSISRAKTFVSLDEGLHLGLDKENLPPLRKDVDKLKEENFVGRSQPNEEGFEYYQLYSHTGVYYLLRSMSSRQSILLLIISIPNTPSPCPWVCFYQSFKGLHSVNNCTYYITLNFFSEKDPYKNKKNTEITTKYATDEVENIIAEKLTTSFHGLRHLFRSHDPTGQGNVSR